MAKSSRLPPARAEHIGSFLRPAELTAELERVYEPKHTALLAGAQEGFKPATFNRR